MKRIVCLCLLLLVVAGVLMSCNEIPSDSEWVQYSEGLEFTSRGDGTCYVSGIGECKDTEIDIPKKSPNEDRVTGIDYQAFRNCKSLTSISIPSGVTSIGNCAFYGCESLTNIILPDGVKSIGSEAFFGCISLKNITIPQGVKSIGSSAFSNCVSLASITMAESVESINHYVFRGCTSLTSITIPAGVKSIGSYAFNGCTSLTSITISDNVNSIGMRAFTGTGYYKNNDNWVDGVLYIGDCLIDAKNAVPANYSIKAGTTCIADEAFYLCTSLTSITIPSSVTNIGATSFWGCSSLKHIIFQGTEEQWSVIRKASNWHPDAESYTITFNGE